ncbi:fimbrial protein [Escherichia coli]|nr:fimbrial protein [Escherichia coli]
MSTCKINNDTDITVSFPPMSLNEVNGTTNAVTTPVGLSCDYYQGTPYIQVTDSTLSGIGDNVLQTNIERMRITLYQGN